MPCLWTLLTALPVLRIKLGSREEAANGINRTALWEIKLLQNTVYTLHNPNLNEIKLGSREEAADGINRTALREIKLLQEIHHPNIISLMDVFGHRSNVSLVFDFMETDLEVIIKDTSIVLTLPHVKSYTMQTLLGLEYLHRIWILHRDLKPNNLLINSQGILKLGDFGLAKYYGSPNRIYTHQVVTRWYRAPELLFGARNYGTGIDMWAVGCILAELLLRVPFLTGDSDLDQLSKIFQALGSPSIETWPDIKSLPDYVHFKYCAGTPLKHIFTATSDDLISLLSRMLTLNPLTRCTCTEALQTEYFSNTPAPTPPECPPPLPASLVTSAHRPYRPSTSPTPPPPHPRNVSPPPHH